MLAHRNRAPGPTGLPVAQASGTIKDVAYNINGPMLKLKPGDPILPKLYRPDEFKEEAMK